MSFYSSVLQKKTVSKLSSSLAPSSVVSSNFVEEKTVEDKSIFSVVIPVYNRREMFKRALASVLAQSFSRFECMVVDDGSCDNLELLFRETVQGDKRFRFKKLVKHSGVAAARNTGVALTSAPWIAFLDSDDTWHRDKLKEHYKLIVTDSPDLSESEEVWVRNGKRVNPCKHHLKKHGDVFLKSLKRCLLTPSSVVVSRTAFHAAWGFDENLKVCEDYDLWLRLSTFCQLNLIDKPLVTRYQGHGDQLSFSSLVKDVFRIKSLKNLLRFLKKERGLGERADASNDTSFLGNPLFRNRSYFEMKKLIFLEIVKRCEIVAGGARKRGRKMRYFYYRILGWIFVFRLKRL